jgi:hypothetical protein
MYKIILIVFLGFLFSCGVDHPFKRGEPSSSNPSNTGGVIETATQSGKTLFIEQVYPSMQSKCFDCHRGEVDTFTLTGESEKDYLFSLIKIVPGDPENSLIILKPLNKEDSHGGGTIWQEGSNEHLIFKEWILNEK